MSSSSISTEMYDLYYETICDHHGTRITKRTKCVPKEGVLIYEIEATYAKQVNPTTYYVFGKSVKEARRRFNAILSWMKIVSITLLVDRTKIDYLLSTPEKNPL